MSPSAQPHASPEPPDGSSRRRALGLAAAAGVVGVAGTRLPSAAAVARRPQRLRRKASRFVYVGGYAGAEGQPAGLSVFRRTRSGDLVLDGEVSGLPNPSWLTTHPALPALYAISEVDSWDGQDGGGVTAYAIDAETGGLTKINDVRIPAGPAHGAVVANGEYLVTADYGSANFAVVRLRPDGGLERTTDTFAVTGRGSDPERQDRPYPHQIVPDPGGAFVLGTDLGTDQVWVWRLDPSSGTLDPAEVPTMQVASGSGARHLAFHPGGAHAYVVSELTSSVTAFGYDAERGTFGWLQTVSSLPPGFAGESFGGEIAVHPSGRYLYVSNRGHDSIAAFRVDRRTGRLEPLGWTPTGGAWPRHFALDPAGDLLLVANQESGSVVELRVGRQGRLRPTGVRVTAESPACVLPV